MSGIGELERRTQRRVAKLFVDELGYEHLGNLSEGDNRNILVEGQLEHFLWAYQGFAEREDGDTVMRRAIAEVVKVAGNTSLSLYDRNRAVYELLRYGVKVKADVGAHNETVWLIDWKTPEKNRFAIAEEVTVKAADPKAHDKRPDIVLYVNGIALGVLELKRSNTSVAKGIPSVRRATGRRALWRGRCDSVGFCSTGRHGTYDATTVSRSFHTDSSSECSNKRAGLAELAPCSPRVYEDTFSSTLTLLLPLLATARSSLLSPLKSPTVTEPENVPAAKLVVAPKPPRPLPNSTDRCRAPSPNLRLPNAPHRRPQNEHGWPWRGLKIG